MEMPILRNIERCLGEKHDRGEHVWKKEWLPVFY